MTTLSDAPSIQLKQEKQGQVYASAWLIKKKRNRKR